MFQSFRRAVIVSVVLLSAGWLIRARDSWSDDAPSSAGDSAAVVGKPATDHEGEKRDGEKRSGPRLPMGYGKLGLTDAQREKVLGLQEKYQDELDALTTQIVRLKEQRDSDLRAVLTDEQRQKLDDAHEARDRKKSAKSGKPSDDKDKSTK